MSPQSALLQRYAPWLVTLVVLGLQLPDVRSAVLIALLLCWLWQDHRSTHEGQIQTPGTAKGLSEKGETTSLESPPAAQAKWTAFRVRGIPAQHDRQSLKELLYRVLRLTTSTDGGLEICSLAIDATESATRVATIEFHEIPPALQSKPWEFKLDEGYLLFDDTFLGFTTLASPDAPKLDIIAVSGLGGHAFGSFKQRTGRYMWLRDSLPDDLAEARVMVYGHESHLYGSQSLQDLEALGRTFCQQLQSLSGSLVPKVYIGHSLGGLIVKQAIIYMGKWGNEIFDVTRGVLFFGVPNQGMDIESLVPMVEGQPNELFLRTLGSESQLLREQCENFKDALGQRDVQVICYYETLLSPTAQKGADDRWKMSGPEKLLVSSSSARHGRDWETGSNVSAINKSHSNMVKFGPHDEYYALVRHRLQRLLESSNSQIQTRPLTPNEQACLRFLAFPEMNSRRNDISEAAEHTCKWIFEHLEFKKWLRGETGLLWIKGKPGSGKSTLFKHVLGQLARPDRFSMVLTFFFHGRGTDLEKTPIGLFRSLLQQLLQRLPETCTALVQQYDQKMTQHGQYWAWHVRELQDQLETSLTKALESSVNIKIMIDALDECGEAAARDLVQFFERLAAKFRSKNLSLSICFTCRHYPILALNYGVELCTEDNNRVDIECFIRSEFTSSHWGEDMEPLRDMICQRAHGVFQWAALVAAKSKDLLSHGENSRKVLHAIEITPPDLVTLYRDLLSSLSTTDQNEASRLMIWICYAERPLSLAELRYALVFHGRNPPRSITECLESDSFSENDGQMEKKLNYLSRGLAETRKAPDGIFVQFIHQSVLDFVAGQTQKLFQEALVDPHNPHLFLSWACLECMGLEDFQHGAFERDWGHGSIAFEHAVVAMPFLRYATKSFMRHFVLAQRAQKLGGSPADIMALGKELKVHENFTVWSWIFGQYSNPTYLHVLAGYGLESCFSEDLFQECRDSIEARDGRGDTPLMAAVSANHQTIVKILLEMGNADIEGCDDFGSTALLLAAEAGHTKIVKELLTHKADVNATDISGKSPLLRASENGHTDTVKLLLEAPGLDTNTRALRGDTALHKAASFEDGALVKLLLDSGSVETDARDNNGETALMKAASLGHWVVVEMLLQAGADATARDHIRETALTRAFQRYYPPDEEVVAVMKVLLDGGADPHSRDLDGRTPLMNAAASTSTGAVKTLLDLGTVDINARDADGSTALIYACRQRRAETVRLLLDTGKVDVDAQGVDGQSALFIVAGFEYEPLLAQLLDVGQLDLNTRDNRGRTPLWRAASLGLQTNVMLLLQAGGADINATDCNGTTPLKAAAEYAAWAAQEMAADREAALNVLKLLLDTGWADVNTPDDHGDTPLCTLVVSGFEAAVKLLLDTGMVDVEARGASGSTAIQLAHQNSHDSIEALLLAHGATLFDLYGLVGIFELDSRCEN